MSIISINNLSFAYDGGADYIFKDVTLMLDSDWRLGFTGRNGRGKTTLLRILSGELEYTGSITSCVTFDYFPFKVKDLSKTGQEIAEEILPNLEDWRLIKELNLLDMPADKLYAPFYTLSGGERSKLLLASLFIKENNFLLIDEPTNHLDANARQAVAKYLSTKKSFILVSHDRAFLDGAVDHIISINRANIDIQKGNFSSYLTNKERLDNFEKAQNDKLKTEIDRLKTAAKRNSEWSQKGHRDSTGGDSSDERQIGYKEFHRKKAGKLDSQAKQMEKRFDKMADEKSKLLKNIETLHQLKISPLNHHSDRLIDIRDLSINYGDNTILSGLNLSVSQGDKIAIVGKNGCGKTSLIKLIISLNQGESLDKTCIDIGGEGNNKACINYGGEIKIAKNLKISYVSQDTSFLSGNLKDFADKNNLDETLFKAILSKLDLMPDTLTGDIRDFSEGQKKKVLLAKSLSEKAHLYIYDEPLNYVDIFSRMQIESLIKTHDLSMLFVEHDAAFSKSVATKTLNM